MQDLTLLDTHSAGYDRIAPLNPLLGLMPILCVQISSGGERSEGG